MTSRERVETTLDHRSPDRVPLDLGGSPVTGMHVSSVYALRQALRLDAPGTPVKVVEPYQMLGEVQPSVAVREPQCFQWLVRQATSNLPLPGRLSPFRGYARSANSRAPFPAAATALDYRD